MSLVRMIRFRLAAVAIAATLTAAPPATAGATTVTAKAADSFVESIGVNVHLGFAGTPYVEHLTTVAQRLSELGVRHVRTGLYPKAPAEYQAIHQLAATGIKTTAILGEVGEPESALPEMLAALKTPELAGTVEAVEGWNEPYVNTEPPKSKVIEDQRRIYEGVKGDPALSSLTVIGPSIIRNENHFVGDISAYLDAGNIHSYPEGEPPEYLIETYVKRAKENSVETPLFATETGYTNATNWTPPTKGENRPVPEEVSATYIPRLYFEYWTRHFVRTFDYELVDEHPDPELKEREDHFGLVRNDLTPKPAFTALHNTISLLSDPGAAFTPGALTYSLSEKAAHPLHSTLLEKRDGIFYLALWRLESMWEPVGKKPIVAPKEPVKIEVPAGVSSFAVYEPTTSAVPIATGGVSKSVSVEVGPGVTLVKLIPATIKPAEIPAAETPAPAATATTTPVAAPVVIEMPFVPPIVLAAAPEPNCLVPKLGGKTLAGARRASRLAECAIGTVKRRGAGEAGQRVVAQRPPSGRSLAAGTKIAVTLGAPAAR